MDNLTSICIDELVMIKSSKPGTSILIERFKTNGLETNDQNVIECFLNNSAQYDRGVRLLENEGH